MKVIFAVVIGVIMWAVSGADRVAAQTGPVPIVSWEILSYELPDLGLNCNEIFLVVTSDRVRRIHLGGSVGVASVLPDSDLPPKTLIAASFLWGGIGVEYLAVRTSGGVSAYKRDIGADSNGTLREITFISLPGAESAGTRATTYISVPSPRTLSLRTPPQSGNDVLLLQSILYWRGYGDEIGEVDGYFGPKTQAAVTLFQRDQGLEADGIAGPLTWAALNYL